MGFARDSGGAAGAGGCSGNAGCGAADGGGRRRINITGALIDPVSLDEAARIVARLASDGRAALIAAGAAGSAFQAAYVCTPNAEILMMAQRDGQLMDALNGADLAVADGSGVVLAARILGYGRIDRTPGFDLTKKLFSDPAAYPFSYYLFGGKPGVAEAAAGKIVAASPRVRIAGCRDGYFAEPDEPGIIDAINASGADILLVALGAPKQEKWICRNRGRLRVPVCIGVGGSLDVYAGSAALPPEFFRRHGLEWLFRLARQPWRAGRMLRLPQYVLCAVRHRLAGAPASAGAGAGRRRA